MTQHAITRAKERLGVDVTQADLDAVLVRLGQAGTMCVRRRNGQEHWLVRLKGVLCGLIVRPGYPGNPARVVTTILTPSMLCGREGRAWLKGRGRSKAANTGAGA